LDTEQAGSLISTANMELYGQAVSGIVELSIDHDAFQLMSATVYGESSIQNNQKEMFGIASTIVNHNGKSGKSITLTIKEFAYAATDGNARFSLFESTSIVGRNNDVGMRTATAGAVNALIGGIDFSNGATEWDGNDLPNNSHRNGMQVSEPAHDIHGIGDNPKSDGSYTRRSTAAHGGTMFNRIHPDHISAGGRSY
jgi:hypothetical protein